MNKIFALFNAKFLLFSPSSTTHVQREVMRDIDFRLAAYSRNGILFSLIIFTSSILIGEYYTFNPKMTLVLMVGLVLTTSIRAYFIFRFDHLYAQGPNRWRKLFFCCSLLGSAWWGFVVANVTWEVGLYYETPILWLYTVAFFAFSLYAFAPFQRFLKVYMFVSFVPCAVIAISTLEITSIFYGIIMLILYFLLCRQGAIVGQSHWDKIQANEDLMRKTIALEAENISTHSSINNQDILYQNLTRELKSSMQEVLGSLKLLKYSKLQLEDEQLVILAEQKNQQQLTLLRNVAELTDISNHKLLLDQHVIDPRYHIEQALNSVSIVAHKKNIEIYSSFAADYPLRIRADAERLEQLIANLINSACQFCLSGEILLSSSYRTEEEPGTLKISIVNKDPLRTPEAEADINAAFSPHYATDIKLGLSLAIIKGLAQCMGGDAGADYKANGYLIFWASVKLPSVSAGMPKTQSLLKLAGKKTLVYQAPHTIADVFGKTLESWGLTVDIVNEEDASLSKMEECVGKDPYQLVIIYTQLNNIEALSFSQKIAEHPQLRSTPQIITLSKLQKKLKQVEDHFLRYPSIEVIYKPIQYRNLQKMIKNLLVVDKKSHAKCSAVENFLTDKHFLLFQQEDIDVAIVKAMLKKIGCKVSVAATLGQCFNQLAQTRFDAFICESHLEDNDMKKFIDKARNANDCLQKNNYKIPILGLTSHELEDEETHCLAAGMEYYIDSPTNIDDLRAILRRFIGRAIHMAENK
ncbi:MAG: signal transduction histidine kinase/CheY-like chemotaxis protein [Candidatus Endobugula sp.]|jgi:signal transduction histidine kinase/CheY-like chemotaxis protein